MGSIKSRIVFLLGMVVPLLLFQNCSGPKSAPLQALENQGGEEGPSTTPREPAGNIVNKLEAHGCFYEGHGDAREYHIREFNEDPNNLAIFHGSFWVPSADVETFQVLNKYYARDKDHLYDESGRSILKLPGDVEVSIPFDRRFLLIPSLEMVIRRGVILQVDYQSFEILHNGNYADRYRPFSSVEGAIHLGKGYILENDQIVFNRRNLNVSLGNIQNFQVLDGVSSSMATDGEFLYIDHIRVNDLSGSPLSYTGQRITDMSQSDSGEFLWNDGTYVYSNNQILGLVSEYRDLGSHWRVVGEAVFHYASSLTDIDLDSFEVLNDSFARDKDRYFYFGSTIRHPINNDGSGGLINLPGNIEPELLGGSLLVANGWIFDKSSENLNSVGQTIDSQNFECLGEYHYRVGGQIYDDSFNLVTQDFVDMGLNPETMKPYFSQYVWYDDQGMINLMGEYYTFPDNHRFQPVNLNWYHDGQAFRSLNYHPEDEQEAIERQIENPNRTNVYQHFYGPTSNLQLVHNEYLFMNNGFVREDSESDFNEFAWDNSVQFFRDDYLINAHQVYWRDTEIEGIDAQTFQYHSENFVSDDNQVFYQTRPTGIANNGGELRRLSYYYWSMGNDVYYTSSSHSTLLDGADPNDLIDDGLYAYSGNLVYYRDILISSDRENFDFYFDDFNYFWSDSVQVGREDIILAGLNPAQTTVYNLASNHALFVGDGRVYYGAEEITEVANAEGNIQTFELSGSSPLTWYWSDGTTVFYGVRVLEGVNPGTFNVTGFNEGSDGSLCVSRFNVSPCP